MRTNSRQHLDSINGRDPTYLESLIRGDFERCHPGETLEDLKRRASFSKEDRGLLRDWIGGSGRSRRSRMRGQGNRTRRAHPQFPLIRRPLSQARSKDRCLTATTVQPGEVPVSSSCETAAANCAGAKGFSSSTLSATPCDSQFRALVPVM